MFNPSDPKVSTSHPVPYIRVVMILYGKMDERAKDKAC